MLSDFELEKIEREYFELIRFHLKQDLNAIIEGLNSRIKIKNDWYNRFIQTARSCYKSSDLDTGAERIFHHFFAPILRFPNSSPLGSDLMFEVSDAFLHIDVKTALVGNPADYKGKINIAINQTSYEVKDSFSPNLPKYYNPAQTQNTQSQKPCLTYAIQIIHEHAKPNINALVLLCIPNGQLYPHYGKNIVRSGKAGHAKGRDIRYNYSAEPYFKLLSERYEEKLFRIELIYLKEGLAVESVTRISDLEVPVHFQF